LTNDEHILNYKERLTKYIQMSEDNNYGVRFKSKTEAIEQLCLKVFGAYPIYGSDFEDLEEETLESMYAKVVSVALECDPIADGKLEPPWEVFTRVKRERDLWIAEAERWRKNTDLYHTVLGQRDRLAEALRIVIADYRLDGRVSAEADILACEALTFVKEKQKKESQSCAECDALASHGYNDGPCETHKI